MIGREGRIVRELRGAGFTVLTRKQWGSKHRALYQWRRINRHFSGKANAFFAHVTVTNRTGDFAADVRVVEMIGYDRFQTGISYNYAIDKVTGAIAIGMPHDAAGAHTLNDKGIDGWPENLNYVGHAIAWIANVGDTPSQACMDAYSAIIAAEKKHGAAERRAGIFPHSKYAYKDCPLESLRKHLGDILRKSKTILTEGDWFDMATKAELRDVVDAAIDAKIDDIVRRVLNHPLPNWAPKPYDEKKGDDLPLWQHAQQARGYAEAAWGEAKKS